MSLFIRACRDCAVVLTSEEIEFYEYRCEPCERVFSERLCAWRHGAHDPEIDEMFAASTRSLH